ncbi:ATP-binding protein [Phenylobacterium montanum]|uniref:histidine kinase n=1 Tax=Phenylobacterium montanum TaxID=2823693 RepID=A0A975FXD8_9CAUL|nr:ATP-binding protein [Caulobacter sp. S6]QUD86577.1 ATPase [Caulobacter sp. S6]
MAAVSASPLPPEPVEGRPAFAELVESLPDPVLVVVSHDAEDPADRRVAFANRAARELLRIQGEGAPLVSSIRNPRVLEAVEESLFGRLEGEAAYEAGGAQDRYWRVSTRPLETLADGGRQALLVMRDETDSRRNERMRADFLANASHELRTPLASLTGFIETLRGHAKDDAVARERFLGVMAAQASRMARLIDDLLSLSRIELNEHIAPEGKVDVALAVLDVLDALSPLAAERGVKLKTSLPERGVATITGDRDQILQVAQNLIDNAAKYTPGGDAVQIEVLVGQTADQAIAPLRASAARLSILNPDLVGGERFVVLRCTDRGPGIAREHLPRLSERFYRVEGQKSGERLGTGLGLAIVKHIVNRHRGGLVVESEEGHGTTFTAYFPWLQQNRHETVA